MESTSTHYCEYRPIAPLRPYVDCFWSSVTSRSDGATCHRVLPDGCIDIILEPRLAGYQAGMVVGTMSRATLFQASGPLEMLAVRFRPAGAWPFLQVPASEITDQQVALADLLPGSFCPAKIFAASTAKRRIRRLEAQLLTLLPMAKSADARVAQAIDRLNRTGLVDEAAAAANLSRQHLARLFRQQVGIGPKTFVRVARLQRMLEFAGGGDGWAQRSLQLGYFDQSHMISDCRRLTGLTPRQLLTSRSGIQV